MKSKLKRVSNRFDLDHFYTRSSKIIKYKIILRFEYI